MNKSRLMAVAAIAALGAACATAPQSDPRLESARIDLQQLKVDSLSATASPQAVAAADAALARAEAAWMDRDSEALVHEVRMVNGNVRLANAEIAAARAETAIAQTVVRRQRASVALSQRDVRSAEAAAAAAQADALMAREEAAGLRADLAAYETRQTELGTMLVFRDVLFQVDSANLRAGAEQRLDPLAAYLSQNSDVRVRIDGHSDSTGAAGYNRELSQQRADSVANYLASRGVNRERFETFGFGEEKPVGSNGTQSGREENRRVEVTLLNS